MAETAELASIVPKQFTDLEVLVGSDENTQIKFDVASGALRTHSNVFDRMLSGPWLESSNPEPVKLPDDDPAAFALLLKILHHRVVASRYFPTTEEIVELTKLCDKYDFVDLARECVETWTKRTIETKDEAMQAHVICFIGWTFKSTEIFKIGWNVLVKHVQLEKNSQHYRLFNYTERQTAGTGTPALFPAYSHVRVTTDLLPGSLGIQDLVQAASDRHQSLHFTLQKFVANLVSEEITNCNAAHGRPGSASCAGSSFGTLVNHLVNHDIAVHIPFPTEVTPDKVVLGEQSLLQRVVSLTTLPITARRSGSCISMAAWTKCLKSFMDADPVLPAKMLAHFD